MNMVPTRGESATINLSVPFTLNDFIPKKPFFSYTGMSPIDNCKNPDCHFVVFGMDNAIPIDIVNLSALQIVHDPMPVKNTPYFYNATGPSGLTMKGDDSEIFIDCQPTDDSGQLLVTEPKQIKPITGDDKKKGPNPFEKLINEVLGPFAEIVEGVLIALLIVLAAKGIILGEVFTITFWLKLIGIAVAIGFMSQVVHGAEEKNIDESTEGLFK